jgi:hypothetical protein
MTNPHFRYFIELQPKDGVAVPRHQESERSREQAKGFIHTMREWLCDHDLLDKVSSLSVTMFGQIQIMCEPSVMQSIRNQDIIAIAAIRQSAGYTESLARWNEAQIH